MAVDHKDSFAWKFNAIEGLGLIIPLRLSFALTQIRRASLGSIADIFLDKVSINSNG